MDPLQNYLASQQKLFDRAGIRPERRTIEIKDGPVRKVHFLHLGQGRPLIMLHGGGSHASEFIDLLGPLSRHYELFVIDRPGCGSTDHFDYRGVDVPAHAVNFIRSFMDAVQLQRAAFLAQSMGAYFSIRFAMEHPGRVSKLIFIGAPAGMHLQIPLLLRMLGTPVLNRFLANTVGRPSIKGMRRLHEQLFMADASRVGEDYLEHSADNQRLPGRFRSFQTLLENVLTLRGWRRDLYIGDRLHELKMPVHFIWGDKDVFEDPISGARKANAIKDHRFITIADAGHCPWLDRPEECARTVIQCMEDREMVEA